MRLNWLIITWVVLWIPLKAGPSRGTCEQRGGQIETITCRDNPEQSYCLLYPPSAGEHPPLVVFLEPAGRGRLPLSLYGQLAEEYGFMMACSNNGRNGPTEIFEEALKAMIGDLEARFGPDTGRMVLCGFSGGAREAFLYSHQVQKHGLMACGAGTSPYAGKEQLRLPFCIGIAGRRDMNYLEVTDVVEEAAALGTPSWMIAFDGPHTWPDTLSLRRAFDQVRVFWSEAGLCRLSDRARSAIRRDLCLQLDSILMQGRVHEAILLRNRILKNPIFNPEELCWQEVLTRLPAGKETEKFERRWHRVRARENRYQDSIVSAFRGIDMAAYKIKGQLRPDSWWRARSREVRRAAGSGDFLVRESASRMHEFTVNICREKGYFSLGEPGGEEQASLYFRAWCSFDPEDPDAWYWLAIACARGGRMQDALDALSESLDHGLSRDRIESTRSFDDLRSDPRFRNLFREPGNDGK